MDRSAARMLGARIGQQMSSWLPQLQQQQDLISAVSDGYGGF